MGGFGKREYAPSFPTAFTYHLYLHVQSLFSVVWMDVMLLSDEVSRDFDCETMQSCWSLLMLKPAGRACAYVGACESKVLYQLL
ncbi:uncharacterized protein PHALS_14577 [Plasmopara halstedii]|uniref:Uncharacterized protein n=1 Tax=Plasmopara halstedii TaxID=4781 RepID=A0A0P1AKU2_PLAHL|nr:uncharacterized protein PHALS_14577 [Plasmopara halstedii]CEG41900.1 hypothetical protein PHALS_14577 [Plasmopara halstedii]|eukprot:XP_024578269.1 hypothetical protein PHALS_14577 [Plasmopara halstedii]